MASHRIQQVTADRLVDYLVLAGGDTEHNRARIEGILDSKPQYMTFVLTHDAVPLARFTVERYGLGLSTWRPWFRDEATRDERAVGRRFIAGALSDILRAERLPFIESSVGDDEDPKRFWRDDLLASGFLTVCRNRHWTRRLRPGQVLDTPTVPGLTFSLHRTVDDEVRSCVKAAKAGSLDRWYRLEARYGGVATDYDAVVLARLDGRAIGACGLLSDEPGDAGIWLKHLGVVPEARRRGIGAALLGEALRECARPGVEMAQALIEEQNEPSIGLFRACGFEPQRDEEEVLCLEARTITAGT